MQIWSSEIKEIEKLHESFKGKIPDLEKELGLLIKTDDPNVLMLYSRRCLEVIITDLCECELKRPRKTEPLKGIIDKLNKEEKVPSHIITSMDHVNSLSIYGAHPKDFDPEQVKPVLNNLATIIKWYLRYKETVIDNIPKQKEEINKEISSNTIEVKGKAIPGKRLYGILSGLIATIVIVFVFLFFTKIIGSGKQTGEPDKSIAVLPFHNDSSDEENQYFINGLMDAILDNLCKIKDLRVIPRTSVEQYRNSPKSIPEIARELNVNYILEGGGQKYEDDIRLTVQLIDVRNDRHIWSKPYNRKTKDIFAVQSEIAQLIADELKAYITPEEKQLIEKPPTASLTAYDFFQRGRDEHMKYLTGGGGREALERAENLYREALEYDSTFAQAYSGLAMAYWNKTRWSEFFSENYMDSVLILADIALSYDNKIGEAYGVKSAYYYFNGKTEQALEEAERAIKFNPNDWMPYWGNGIIYSNLDLVKSIYNYTKAISLNRGSMLPQLLINLGWVYHQAGFIKKYRNCIQEALKLTGDSTGYYANLGRSENYQGNFAKAIEFLERGHKIDTNRMDIMASLGYSHILLGHYRESLKYYKTYVERLEASGGGDLQNMQRVGYVFWHNGYKEKAEYYFNKQLEYCNESIELGREYSRNLSAFYDLAGIYAFRGERDKAIENLKKFNQRKWMGFFLARFIKQDPLFNSIRNDPEFLEIVRDIEKKYQAEHERVRSWLGEQGML